MSRPAALCTRFRQVHQKTECVPLKDTSPVLRGTLSTPVTFHTAWNPPFPVIFRIGTDLAPLPGVDTCLQGVYRQRKPRKSALFKIVKTHYERFEEVYEERFAGSYGRFRPVIRDVVEKYLACGDLKEGFARVRCPDCRHEFLLPFSCKTRAVCTSCHAKRSAAFAEWLNTTVLWPIPHRQIVLTIAGLSLLLPLPQYILMGMSLSMVVYIGMNYQAQIQLYGSVQM